MFGRDDPSERERKTERARERKTIQIVDHPHHQQTPLYPKTHTDIADTHTERESGRERERRERERVFGRDERSERERDR